MIRPAAFDIHMIRIALIIRIINAFVRLTVNADGIAWMGYGTCEYPHIASVFKAAATGIILTAGVPALHHDIPLAAAPVTVIGTVFHGTT